MRRFFGKLLLAASCVTALPLGRRCESNDDLAGLSPYLVLVGFFLGLFLCACRFILDGAPDFVRGALLLAASVVASGAIHLDGLMDTCDGIFSCRDRDRMLEIMKDSRVGNFGAVGGILLLFLKFAAFASLSLAPVAVACLFLVPACARASEVVAIGFFPYARDEGMGKIWHDTTGYAEMTMSVITVCGAGVGLWLLLDDPMPLVSCAVTLSCGMAAAAFIASKLKGLTGDAYGAVVEVSEAAGLVAVAILLHA